MSRSQLLSRAWALTWRNRVLWVFGIALALFAGHGVPMPRYALRSADLSRMPLRLQQLRDLAIRIPWLGWLESFLPAIAAAAATLAVVGLVVSLAAAIIRYTSAGALISAADAAQQQCTVAFGAALRAGWNRFLRLLAIDLVIGLVGGSLLLAALVLVAILSVVLALPGVALVSAGESARAVGIIAILGATAIFFLSTIVIALAVGITASIVSHWAARACVLDRKGMFESIGTGLRLLRHRLAPSLGTWLTMALVTICLMAVIAPIALIAAGAMVAIGVFLWQGAREAAPVIAYAVVAAVGLGLVGSVLQGIYLAFGSTYWTLAYRELEPGE